MHSVGVVSFCVLLVILVTQCGEAYAAVDYNVTVGLTLPLMSSLRIIDLGLFFVEGFQYFEQWIQQNPITVKDANGNPLNLGLVFDYKNDGFRGDLVRQYYQEFVKNSSASFLLAPFGTNNALTAANITEEAGWTLLSYTNRNTRIPLDKRRVFGFLTPDDQKYQVSLAPLRVAGARTVVVLQRTFIRGQPHKDQECGHPNFKLAMKLQGLEDVAFIDLVVGIHSNSSLWNKTQIKYIKDQVLEVIKLDPDVWMVCDQSSTAPFLEVFRREGYTPRAFITINEVADAVDFETVVTSYDVETNFPETPHFGTIEKLNTSFHEMFNKDLSETTFSTFLPGLAIKRVLEELSENEDVKFEVDGYNRLSVANFQGVCSSSSSTSDGFMYLQDLFARRLVQLRMETVIGTVSWDAQHRQQRQSLLTQVRKDSRSVIAPLSVQAKDTQFVYPMPTWEERIFNPEFGHGTEVAAAILAGVVIVSCLIWALFIFLSMSRCISQDMHRTVKASSPMFMYLILLGAIILCCSIFVTFPNTITRFSCIARAWFVDLGFVILFGPFFAKTFRIERLWTRRSTAIFKISNLMILCYVLILIGAHVIILIFMTAFGDIKRVEQVVDPIRPINNYYKCQVNDFFNIMTYLLIILNAILLLCGAVLAVRIRNIPLNIYNESKIIFFSVYNVIFFSIIVLILSTPIEVNRFTQFFLISLFTILGAGLTINVLFGFKAFSEIKDPSSAATSANSLGSKKPKKKRATTSVSITTDDEQSN